MRQFSNRQKLFFCIGLGFLILFLLVWLVVYPLIGKIGQISETYLSNQQILAKLSYRETAAKKLQEGFQQMQVDFSRIENAFLKQEEIVGFIRTLEAIAQKTGNDFDIKLLGSPNTASGSSDSGGSAESSLSFQITLWGGFPNLLKFSVSLEDTPYQPYRLIEIDNLNVKKLEEGVSTESGSGTKTGGLKSILDIKIYTQ